MAYSARNPNPATKRLPFSRIHLAELEIGAQQDKLAALIPLMGRDYFFKDYNFQEPTMSPDWVENHTSGGTETAFAFNKQRNGAVRGATGTDANNVVQLGYANELFDAADKPSMLIRFKAPAAVTSFVIEAGFSDPETAEAAVSTSALTAAAVPTVINGVTDGGWFVINTGLTLTTAAVVGVGTSTTAAGAKPATAYTPTASKYIDIIVHVEAAETICSVWDDGKPVFQLTVASGPDTGVLMRPWFKVKTLNTTTKQIDIVKWIVWAEENES